MNEDFVTYEQAKALKKLGFDWDTIAFYLDTVLITKTINWHTTVNATDLPIISAPTLAQAQKWLRDKDINIEVYCFKLALPLPPKLGWDFCIVDNEDKEMVKKDYTTNYDTYEKALSAGIDKALEILKQQSNGNQD